MSKMMYPILFQHHNSYRKDINECQLQTDNCDDASTTCQNTISGFMCNCLPGFSRVTPTLCQDPTGCCPSFPNDEINSRFILLNDGQCAFFEPDSFGNFTTYQSSLCGIDSSSLNVTGGRLLELSSKDPTQPVDTSLKDLVTPHLLLPSTFPPVIFVDFERNGINQYIWGNGNNDELLSDDEGWILGRPQSGVGLNCGAITRQSEDFGFTNVRCDNVGVAYCSVDLVVCPPAVPARVVLTFTHAFGQDAQHDESLDDPTSALSQAYVNLIEDVMNVATRDQKVVTVAGFSSGSVNAFVEVIIVKPHQVQNYKDLADAIINAGELDENGFLTITRANGDTIVLDSNRLDVDDISNHRCQSVTCQNGGSCTDDEKLIEAICTCADGYQGQRCEAIKEDSSAGLVIALSLVAIGILLLFCGCLCCLCILSKRSHRNQDKMSYRYKEPLTIPEQFDMLTLREDFDQRVVINAVARLHDGFAESNGSQRIVRNRGVNISEVLSKRDEGSSLDDQKLSHFERVFYNSGKPQVKKM
ncbi:hypothetical protein BSL78_16885 [Apostichopus japonicus]|uniref:EGF-like domain-containing protein n=1 Tax=Stichopus japonicus TaxID=307972 RepID=A0A2G8KE30_STIJA|nr:hypothetical protein BSL78_16885 [Apostichopus japonicus]